MRFLISVLAATLAMPLAAAEPWKIYITNDACSDYTWGFDEPTTRRAFADLVRGHLDAMNAGGDAYNMSVTLEAQCFLERYPDRKAELIKRLKEGRVYMSPFLNNSLWAFQSAESLVRTLYPARRLEREWGLAPIAVAEHIEHPALPWGVASILAGCGIRWLSVPFYAYDSTFKDLQNPPLFVYEGPDGARIRVVMDAWSSLKASYMQGLRLLRKPELAESEWLPHYRELGAAYPLRFALASGTHGDTSPKSGGQAAQFAAAMEEFNRVHDAVKLVNATLPEFCRAVDQAEEKRPFLKVVRGDFGHSWDAWPVSLAKYVADTREGERAFLAAESLIALAGEDAARRTRADRERAEWLWTMLADHAWNGSDAANKVVNAKLRQAWSRELNELASALQQRAWQALGLKADPTAITEFNPTSVPHEGLAGFGFRTRPAGAARPAESGLENAYYKIFIEPATGAIASLVYKPSGKELLREPIGPGPVEVHLEGDQIRIEMRVNRPASNEPFALYHYFPFAGSRLRIETTGAVIDPAADLLPGADPKRFAVQGFVDISEPDGAGVTIAPVDAYLLRTDLGSRPAFEVVSNQQNYKEVKQDQNGETEFRFRYVLRAHAGRASDAELVAWARTAQHPLVRVAGSLGKPPRAPALDARRAVALCLKPADDLVRGGMILRFQEVAGRSGAISIRTGGRVSAVDLLERDVPGPVSVRGRGFGAVRIVR